MNPPTENPFFEAGPDAILLDELSLAGRTSVLERLGPANFRSKGFSFIGFLETLYDYIAEQSNTPAAAAAPLTVETPAMPTDATLVADPATPPAAIDDASPDVEPDAQFDAATTLENP